MSRLPRTRGDRPAIGIELNSTYQAPPHPRGSTHSKVSVLVFGVGSPAPAGIDPWGMGVSGTPRRLPRTRGDRPVRMHCTTKFCSAPPHPRGSTRSSYGRKRMETGSPAPAGIDPACRWPAGTRHGLPRTRGDRPEALWSNLACRMAPPHPRGSTPGTAADNGYFPGSPAPAGIDPFRAEHKRSPTGLPRTRGDRPLVGKAQTEWAKAPPHPRGSTR